MKNLTLIAVFMIIVIADYTNAESTIEDKTIVDGIDGTVKGRQDAGQYLTFAKNILSKINLQGNNYLTGSFENELQYIEDTKSMGEEFIMKLNSVEEGTKFRLVLNTLNYMWFFARVINRTSISDESLRDTGDYILKENTRISYPIRFIMYYCVPTDYLERGFLDYFLNVLDIDPLVLPQERCNQLMADIIASEKETDAGMYIKFAKRVYELSNLKDNAYLRKKFGNELNYIERTLNMKEEFIKNLKTGVEKIKFTLVLQHINYLWVSASCTDTPINVSNPELKGYIKQEYIIMKTGKIKSAIEWILQFCVMDYTNGGFYEFLSNAIDSGSPSRALGLPQLERWSSQISTMIADSHKYVAFGNKIFALLNLKSIDFVSATIQNSIQEVKTKIENRMKDVNLISDQDINTLGYILNNVDQFVSVANNKEYSETPIGEKTYEDLEKLIKETESGIRTYLEEYIKIEIARRQEMGKGSKGLREYGFLKFVSSILFPVDPIVLAALAEEDDDSDDLDN